MLTRTARPSGVLMRKTADIYPADEPWTVVVVVVAGHNQFRLLSVVNTTRRYVWKNRDDINLLINGCRYLSHALVNLSAFVNVLSRKVHTMWVSRHVRIGGMGGPGTRAISR